MQDGETKEKSNCYLEVVTFLWINVSSYNVNIMNTYIK